MSHPLTINAEISRDWHIPVTGRLVIRLSCPQVTDIRPHLIPSRPILSHPYHHCHCYCQHNHYLHCHPIPIKPNTTRLTPTPSSYHSHCHHHLLSPLPSPCPSSSHPIPSLPHLCLIPVPSKANPTYSIPILLPCLTHSFVLSYPHLTVSPPLCYPCPITTDISMAIPMSSPSPPAPPSLFCPIPSHSQHGVTTAYQCQGAVVPTPALSPHPTTSNGVQLGGDTDPFATGTSCPCCHQHRVTTGRQAVRPMGSTLSVAQPFSP